MLLNFVVLFRNVTNLCTVITIVVMKIVKAMEKPKTEKQLVLEALSKRIQELAPMVTYRMRNKWALDNFKGPSTVDKYFSGRLTPDKITAEKLIHDMEQKIAAAKNATAKAT